MTSNFGIGTYQSLSGGVTSLFGTLGGTYGYLLDTTIQGPAQAAWQPAKEIGLDNTGSSVVRGFASLTWSYPTLQHAKWNHFWRLNQFAQAQAPGFEQLVLLQFPDPAQNGTLVRMLGRWQPLAEERTASSFQNVQFTFTQLGLAQLAANTPISVI